MDNRNKVYLDNIAVCILVARAAARDERLAPVQDVIRIAFPGGAGLEARRVRPRPRFGQAIAREAVHGC